jgi:hypothetical protein
VPIDRKFNEDQHFDEQPVFVPGLSKPNPEFEKENASFFQAKNVSSTGFFSLSIRA